MTKKESDKPFKKAAHKRARCAEHARDLTIDEPPAKKEYGNPWGAPKDGKQWIDAKVWPLIMRK
jgi:hypothetical protein